jgi:hypothetical protein
MKKSPSVPIMTTMLHRFEGHLPGAILVLLLLALPARVVDAEVELYRAQNRPAAELAPLAAALLEPAGTAFADPGTEILILKGPPEALREAVDLLRRLDVPLTSYRIETVLTSQGELLSLGASAEGWIELGDLRLLRPGDSELSMLLLSLFDHTRARFHSQVSVLQGHRADIWTGSVIAPQLHVFRDEEAGEVETRIFTSTPALELRSGLSVRPHGRPDKGVDLEIQPVVEESTPGGIVVTGAATRVRVRPGEIVAIGTTSGERTISGVQIPMDAYGSRELSHTMVLVRVQVLSAGE